MGRPGCRWIFSVVRTGAFSLAVFGSVGVAYGQDVVTTTSGETTTTSSVQRIRVPDDFEGNGYVSVQFVRDPSSDELFMSPLSYGIAPFSIDRGAIS